MTWTRISVDLPQGVLDLLSVLAHETYRSPREQASYCLELGVRHVALALNQARARLLDAELLADAPPLTQLIEDLDHVPAP